jgi:hypothetical protein
MNDEPKGKRPLIPGATTHAILPLNRKMRRAQKYGHRVKPEFGKAG